MREDTLGEVDGALGLLDLDACGGRWISGMPFILYILFYVHI